MASKFKMITCRDDESLRLKLTGEFDAGSAWCVLEEIKKTAGEFDNIIIDTDSLEEIYPFGVHIFHQILKDLRGYNLCIQFTGKKADEISPEEGLNINCARDPKESKILKQKGMI